MTSSPDLIGSVIGPYRITKALGTGTMGDVYEAAHTETGAAVALKILHSHHQGSEAAARFLREGKTLGLFKHQNIVELLDVGQGSDGSMFLATELIRGVSLRDLVAEGPVEPRRALIIIEQVLAALGAAHAAGVVHRDVKPDNVMLVDGGSAAGTDLVKVLDFGVAKLLGDAPKRLGEANLTQAGLSVFGSPDYMAPEVAVGDPVDTRTDIYSAGAVLFELLTGKPVFEPADPTDPTEILRLAITKPAPALAARAPERSFTPQLEHVVATALAKVPKQRFQSADEMIAAVRAARQPLDPPSPSPSAVKRGVADVRTEPVRRGARLASVRSWARGHTFVLVAGAVTVLAVIVVAIVLGGS
jgi:serine/threonine-protein kinase